MLVLRIKRITFQESKNLSAQSVILVQEVSVRDYRSVCGIFEFARKNITGCSCRCYLFLL